MDWRAAIFARVKRWSYELKSIFEHFSTRRFVIIFLSFFVGAIRIPAEDSLPAVRNYFEKKKLEKRAFGSHENPRILTRCSPKQ